MKHLKMLWIASIAMVAVMAFATTALATQATSPKGTLYTGTLAGSGTASFHGVVTVSCQAALEGVINSHGPSVTGKGQPIKWEYIKCEGAIIHSLKLGSIEIHSLGEGVGTITSSGTEGLATIPSLGINCIYTTENTDLGIITDSSVTGGKAEIDLSGSIPRTGGSGGIFCGSSAQMTGHATINTPSEIFID